MKMVALKEFRYAGRQLLSGDPFEARERDVRLLEAIKNARPVNQLDDKPAAAADEQKGSETPAKRTYKRRDMKAE
ncbi:MULTISPECIES: hypothetical protein [Pseudomonas]|uniref:hypothetical protein n=1 Tax=Pseudomonas TaxID=286 RepID=UPI001E40963A|nr:MULTISPECIES: hypothetical protein [Pseudomonas]CAH0650535.1 hypothetical protein PSNVIR_04835 [Pseudomonas sp. Nvir]